MNKNMTCYYIVTMSAGTDSAKPGSRTVDFIVPFRAAYVSTGVVSSPRVNVTGTVQFLDGADLHNHRIINLGAPINPTDAANQNTVLASSPFVAKGDLMTHNGVTAVRRSVGTVGQMLMTVPANADGLGWVDLTMAKGDLVTSDGVTQAPIILPAAADGAVLVGDDRVATMTTWQPLATGQLLTTNQLSNPTALVHGTDGQVLSPNAAADAGLTWVSPWTSFTVEASFAGMVDGPELHDVVFVYWGDMISAQIPRIEFTGTGAKITTNACIPANRLPENECRFHRTCVNDTVGSYTLIWATRSARTFIFSGGLADSTVFTGATGLSVIGPYTLMWNILL
jgi:hypothetical protein